MCTTLFPFSVACWDKIDCRVDKAVLRQLYALLKCAVKWTGIPKWILFKRHLKRLQKLWSPVFEKIMFLQKKSRIQASFIKYPELPNNSRGALVQKSSEVYSETSMMSHAGLRATSLFILSCNHRELDRTNPTDGDICKIFYKEERKKQQRPFILLYFEIRIFQGHFPPPNKAALLGAIGCSHLLR